MGESVAMVVKQTSLFAMLPVPSSVINAVFSLTEFVSKNQEQTENGQQFLREII